MSWSRSAAVARTNLLLQVRDPAAHIMMVAIPLIMVPFLMPAARLQLQAQGFIHANGAEQVVPGFGILFAFLSVQQVITLFFNEHNWGTWDRLRASAASTTDILAGKVSVAYAIQLVQLMAVLGLGALFYGFRPNGSATALLLVVALFSAVLCAFGVMMVALTRTRDLALTASNMIGMLMAGVGGVLGPTSSFPGWAQTLSHVSPAYWVMKAIGQLSLQGAGLSQVFGSLAMLTGFGALFLAVSVIRFRVDETKVGIDT